MELEQRVEQVLEERVRPMLSGHGGGVRLAGCEAGMVSVELLGACAGCPSADLSTMGFIEDTLRTELPEVRSVELRRAADPDLLAFARKILARGDGT